MTSVPTLIIGAGQAGLSVSHFLRARGHPHRILERGRPVERWRSERWDSFSLVTPAWMLRLPGHAWTGGDQNAFLTKAETLAYLEDFAAAAEPNILSGVEAKVVECGEAGGFQTRTADGTVWTSQQVVIATGPGHIARTPPSAAFLDKRWFQLHSKDYRNPRSLPEGGVLVVGSGQSGVQIADELLRSGRDVVLSLGTSARLPRRYRGYDAMWWIQEMGGYDRRVGDVPRREDQDLRNPHLGTKTLNLHALAASGLRLAGRFQSVQGTVATFAPDVDVALKKADLFELSFRRRVDAFILKNKLDAAPPEPPEAWSLPASLARSVGTSLDLEQSGIRTVLWATGFALDFSWVHAPAFDLEGMPIHQRGVTACHGLYFIGLPWLYKQKSALIFGIEEDAEHIASHILSRAT